MRLRWKTIRKVWATAGSSVLAILTVWGLIAYQAWGVEGSLADGVSVEVSETELAWIFEPRRAGASPGLLFFPGALVDPRAYAPLARAAAEAGATAILVKVPFRGGFSLAAPSEVSGRALEALSPYPGGRWVVAGHSKGAFYAAEFANAHLDRTAALVLLGSSHPRRLDLSAAPFPVTKIFATRDGIASPARARASAHNLPRSTRWVRIEGGNHSQFGSYGFQPGDRFATISRERQRKIVVGEILRALVKDGAMSSADQPQPTDEALPAGDVLDFFEEKKPES